MREIRKYKNKYDSIMGFGNEVMEGKGFYISYNPDPNSSSMSKITGGLLNMFTSEPMDDNKETALVKEGGKKKIFYILNGDFRKDYEKLVLKGFKKCYEFYLSKKDKYGSNWSTDHELK